MAQLLNFLPTFCAGPIVGMQGIHRAACVKISVRFLGGSHNGEHTVDITLKFLVGIGLQEIACTFDCLIYIRIIE